MIKLPLHRMHIAAGSAHHQASVGYPQPIVCAGDVAALEAECEALRKVAEAARSLDRLIGGKQLHQLGVEIAKACVREKRIIQDALDALPKP